MCGKEYLCTGSFEYVGREYLCTDGLAAGLAAESFVMQTVGGSEGASQVVLWTEFGKGVVQFGRRPL